MHPENVTRTLEGKNPKVHYFDVLPSCLDKSFELIEEGRLDEWDSVLTARQTAGRGQMRRKWFSLEGNLFAAIRLPNIRTFNTPAASVAISALFVNGLRSFGCPIMIKWPNDLVLRQEGAYAKIAGILIEEKNRALVAGVGVNIVRSPDPEELRSGAAIGAASLLHNCREDPLPASSELWRLLVKHIFSVYKNGPVFSDIWKNLAEELLLWRGQRVVVSDDSETVAGRLAGLSDNGGALLETDMGIVEKLTGSMARAESSNL